MTNYIDIIILALIFIFAVAGFSKGFFKSIISLVGGIVSLIIAVYLTSSVAEKLIGVEFINNIFGVGGSIEKMIEQGIGKIAGMNVAISNTSEIHTILTDKVNLPGFLADVLSKVIISAIDGGQLNMSIAQYVAPVLANFIYLAIVGIMLFIVLRILVKIFEAIANKLTANKTIAGLDKLLGLLIGAVKGLVVVVMLFGVLAFFISNQILQPFNEELAKSNIGKAISEPVFEFVAKNVDIDKIIADLTGKKQEDNLETSVANFKTEQNSKDFAVVATDADIIALLDAIKAAKAFNDTNLTVELGFTVPEVQAFTKTINDANEDYDAIVTAITADETANKADIVTRLTAIKTAYESVKANIETKTAAV